MSRIPQGCRTLGGSWAEGVNRCRESFFATFFSRGYMSFLPSGLQLLESVWEKYPSAFRNRLVTLNSPYAEPCVLMGDPTLAALAYMSAHHAPHERPLRLCYAQKVYRRGESNEDPFESYQVGAELLGWNGHGAEVEMLSLIMESFEKLSIPLPTIVLGDVQILKHLCTALSREEEKGLLAALSVASYEEYYRRIERISFQNGTAPFLQALPHLKGGEEVLRKAKDLCPELPLEDLREIVSALKELGYGKNLRLDLSLFREIGYYSGPVFDIYLPREGRSLGGGGRYDGLLSQYGIVGQALGFNIDLERMARNLPEAVASETVMVWGGDISSPQALIYAKEIIRLGRRTELSWHEDSKASRNLALIRGYRWWLDGKTGQLYDLAAEKTSPKERNEWLTEEFA